MKVLILPSWYGDQPSDQYGSFFRDQAIALQQHSHLEIGVIAPQIVSLPKFITGRHSRKLNRALDIGVPTLRKKVVNAIPKARFFTAKAWTQGATELYDQFISDYFVPDLIHAHGTIYAGSAAYALKRKYDIPFIITEHNSNFITGGYSKYQLRLAQQAIAQAGQLISVSEFLKRNLLQQRLGLDTGWKVIPNIVRDAFFSSELAVLQESVTVFGSVGNLRAIKQFDSLITAFHRAFHADSTKRLRIVGDGSERPRLARLITHLGLDNQVELLGRLPTEEIPAFLQEIDVFVSSSRFETFGVAVAEALALGKVVVATQSGGVDELIHEGNGILVAPGGNDAMTEALREVCQRSGEWKGQAIRDEIARKFSSQAVSSALVQVYTDVLAAEV